MAAWNFAYFAVFSGICLSGWGNSWQFRQCWHHGTSAARLLSCNRSRWWQMCAMTYQKNSHSYIFFLDCNVKYKSEQECFGHVQGSALSWLDGQKQQNRKLRYIMDDILTVHASRSNNQNKKTLHHPWWEMCWKVSLLCGSVSALSALWRRTSTYIDTRNSTIAWCCCWVNPHLISAMKRRLYFHPPLSRHLVVWVVVTTDAEAEELAGGALNLEPLDLQGTLEEPVAGLEVPVASPQEMHTADGQEVSGGQPLQEWLELVWMRERRMEREREGQRVRRECGGVTENVKREELGWRLHQVKCEDAKMEQSRLLSTTFHLNFSVKNIRNRTSEEKEGCFYFFFNF